MANVYPSVHGNQTVSHHKHTHPHHITVIPLITPPDSEPGVFECDINRVNVVTRVKVQQSPCSVKQTHLACLYTELVAVLYPVDEGLHGQNTLQSVVID